MKAIDAVLFDPVGIVVDEHGKSYEDAAPALAELDALGVKAIAVTSLTEAELHRYHEITAALAPPDLLTWLHRGR